MNTRIRLPKAKIVRSLYQEYHLASANSACNKFIISGYRRHYDPRIMSLQRDAPMRIDTDERIELPIGRALELRVAFCDVQSSRRSSRNIDRSASVSLEEIGALLYYATGIAGSSEKAQHYARHVPSSGGLGAVEAYLVSLRVDSVACGIYHFNSLSKEIELVKEGQYEHWLKNHVLFQPEFAECGCLLLLVAAVGRLVEKYGERGYRLSLIDVGHVSQNIYLTATALGLKVCATGGFVEDEIDLALGLDGTSNATMLAVAIGR